MKALLLEDYDRLIYTDVPDPSVEPGEVLVQVAACGICSSDVDGMDGSTGRRIPPIIMGHRRRNDRRARAGRYRVASGRPGNLWLRHSLRAVHLLPPRPDQLMRSPALDGGFGARGTHKRFLRRIRRRSTTDLVGLPDTLSFAAAAWAEPLSVAAHAVARRHERFMTVLSS